MSLIGIITFNIHDDQFFLDIPSQHHSSSGSITCLTLQYRKTGLKEVVQ